MSPGGLGEVVELELRLLLPSVRSDTAEVQRLLHPDFREIGASGQVWQRDAIVQELARDPGEETHARDIEARRLAAGVVLVTYTAKGGAGRSLRSSVWVNGDGGWRCVFHQGTPVHV